MLHLYFCHGSTYSIFSVVAYFITLNSLKPLKFWILASLDTLRIACHCQAYGYYNHSVDIIVSSCIPNIGINARWMQNGVTVAGGNGAGSKLNQLYYPLGLYVDDETVYIAAHYNHRIVEWKNGVSNGQVVAGGNGSGNKNNQLNGPSDVIVDKENDSLIICDRNNKRVVRWSRQNSTSGETIISDVDCSGLAMDNDGYLYVSDVSKHEVKRWKLGDTDGVVVAGGNGMGDRPDQFNGPNCIFVDQDQSVYISDGNNHRVMKWIKGAKEGIVVAGGQGQGKDLTQLCYPREIVVDQSGTVYVADCSNHRVVCWLKEAIQGRILVGGNGHGQKPYQLSCPFGLSFDKQGNLYVVENNNHRVQKFNIDPISNI